MTAHLSVAFEHARLLQAFAYMHPAEIPTVTALAARLGKDDSNLRKTIKVLSGLDLLDVRSTAPLDANLTDLGREHLAAVERAMNPAAASPSPEGFMALHHDQIGPDPDNARKTSGLSPEAIQEMADSLQDKGVLQQPEVRANPAYVPGGSEPEFLLTMGERRWRAWGKLIADGIWPTDKLVTCKLSARDDAERLEAGLVENLQRADINNLEMGEGFKALHDLHRRTPQDIAKKVGKTPRFVQIAIKVAREADQVDKDKYVESEKLYAEAKAKNLPGVKRTFTWEELRDSVKTARYISALEKRDRLTLIAAELALKVDTDPDKYGPHTTYGGQHLTMISTPPGGGHWGVADDLGIIIDHRESGTIYAGVTSQAREWLKDAGFDADPRGYVDKLATDVLGPMPVKLAKEAGVWITQWLNPPKPKPPEIIAPPPAPPADDAPARDTFADQIRQVNAEELEEGQVIVKPTDLGGSMIAGSFTAVEQAAPAPARDDSQLSPLPFIALVETGHKITNFGIETRGGALRGCRVGNYFSGPDAKLASELIAKRYIMFVQASNGGELLASLTQAGWDYIDGSIDDARLDEIWEDNLSSDQVTALDTQGRRYLTDWLIDPIKVAQVQPAASAEDAPADTTNAVRENGTVAETIAPQFDDTAEALEAAEYKIAADEVDACIQRCAGYLLTFAKIADPIETHVAIGTKDEAAELIEVLIASGQYETIDLYVGGRTANAVVQSWTRQQ